MSGNGREISITLLLAIITVVSPLITSSSSGQSIDPEILNPFVSHRFVRSSQNIEENSLLALSDIYYFVSIMNLTGEQIDPVMRSEIITRLQSYQNADGGFGDWYNDRSKAGSTMRAIRILKQLGSEPVNITGASAFLSRLQVSGLLYGNYGFRSSLKEGDADISSTYNAIQGLMDLGAPLPNRTGEEFYVKDHQNFDGGFGYQTNRESGVFWDSTVLHTHRGLLSADMLDIEPDFPDEAHDFILSNQESTGGFSNTPGTGARVSYTYNAITSLRSMGWTIPRTEDVVSFILSNQMQSGGFIEYSLDTKEGLHTTFFAVNVLLDLDEDFDRIKINEFVLNYISERFDGGFGDYPGLGSNSRITFDAVSTLNRIGRSPDDRYAVSEFIHGFYNPDGGYGADGSSNIETTYRSVITLQLLEEELDDQDLTAKYIQEAQNNDGGFGFAVDYMSRGAYTYRAVRTLDILGKEPFDLDGAVRYLRSLQNRDGGFGNYFGEEDSDITSSYRAVRGLHILGSGPIDKEGTIDFLKNSQNMDGGFRRSPTDMIAPGNYSTSLYTYNAIIALHFLGDQPSDHDGVNSFIRSLRNPDLGFGEKEFFTSRVSDTFTSIWSAMILNRRELDAPPSIENVTFPNLATSTSDWANITVRYSDPEGQRPEYIHLLIDDLRIPMRPIGDLNYSANIQLPPGDYKFHIAASDGINNIISGPFSIVFVEEGEAPQVTLVLEPKEGLDDTVFVFTAMVEGNSDIQFAEIRLDDNVWKRMEDNENGSFSFTTTLHSGLHTVRARTFTGSNYGYTDRISGPVVYSRNSTRPEWDIYLKIKDLIMKERGLSINYTDVERDVVSGRISWKVNLDGEYLYVNYEGTEIIDEKDNSDEKLIWLYVLIAVLIIGLIPVIGIIFGKRRRIFSGLFGEVSR